MDSVADYSSDQEYSSDQSRAVVEVGMEEEDYMIAIDEMSDAAECENADETAISLQEVDDLAYVANYAADSMGVGLVDVESVITFVGSGSTSKAPALSTSSSDCSSEGDAAEHDAGEESKISDSDTDEELDNGKKASLRLKWKDLLTEEEADNLPSGPLRTKNEVAEVPCAVLVSKVEPEQTPLQAVGEVLYRIDAEATLVVQAHYTNTPLNEGSLLCTSMGRVLGGIQEIFGPVHSPFYVVKLTRPVAEEDGAMLQGLEEPQNQREADFSVGSTVYTVSEHASFLTVGALQMLKQRQVKGSDASNAFDEEPPDEEREYSDDEQELAARQARNQAKKALRPGAVPAKKRSAPRSSQHQQQRRVPAAAAPIGYPQACPAVSTAMYFPAQWGAGSFLPAQLQQPYFAPPPVPAGAHYPPPYPPGPAPCAMQQLCPYPYPYPFPPLSDSGGHAQLAWPPQQR